MKKVFIILCLMYFSFGHVSAGICFPESTVHEINGEQKYTRFNGLMENAFDFPLFYVKKPKEIGFSYNKSWSKSCGSIDISEKNMLTVFDFGFKNSLMLSMNIFIVISLYIFPIFYFTLFSWKQKEHILIRLFAIICFIFFWSIPYFFFYMRL